MAYNTLHVALHMQRLFHVFHTPYKILRHFILKKKKSPNAIPLFILLACSESFSHSAPECSLTQKTCHLLATHHPPAACPLSCCCLMCRCFAFRHTALAALWSYTTCLPHLQFHLQLSWSAAVPHWLLCLSKWFRISWQSWLTLQGAID